MTSAQLHPLVGQTDIVERIKGRLNDAPMPTEWLLDECAAEIERLRTALRAVRACTDPAWAAQIVKDALREEQ
jgi:hypothetical protein